jgi:tetratricopeptide (TPR) repeat protein
MDIPRELKDRLRIGRVVPFVGAGVSMSVKAKQTGERLFPSWKTLLEEAANRLDEEAKAAYANAVRSLLEIEPPDYLDAARRARAGLGPVWFRFLKEQLDQPREMANDETLNLAETIWNLGSHLVITTNYDKVLHWASPHRDNLVIWDIEAPAEQSRAIRGDLNRPSVWHLHGYIDNAADLILTPDGYSRLYPEAGQVENRYKAALSTLHQFMTSHTFLFIGFGFDDAYFGMQLRGISEIFQGSTGPHYVLTRAADREKIRTLDLPVEIISVEDYGLPLLDGLREFAKIAAEAGSQTSPDESEPERIIRAAHVASYDPRNPVFYVPYRSKGDQVIGREETISAVRDQLVRGRRTAVGQTAAFEGLGGLGKTQIAVEYAYRYRDEYPNGVIWLDADHDIDAQLTDLADRARWTAPESEHKYKFEIARHRLRTYSDCLIIFDNVESFDAITDYLPEPQANPHILITSRTEQPGFTPVPLDLLDGNLSLNLLLQEAGRSRQPAVDTEMEAAREIANTFDGLPLALELAGAYIRYRQLQWKEYCDLLRQNLKAALPGKFLGGSFTHHEKDIYSTLKINEEAFSEEPRLRDVLDLLTWSGSAPMGSSLMVTLLGLQHASELIGALSLGTALRLIQKSPESERYSIHRLLREVRREDVLLTGKEDWVSETCDRIGNWFEERREDFDDLSDFEAEIDHLQAWQIHSSEYAVKHVARLMWLQAYPPFHRGRYKETKDRLQSALTALEQSKVEDLLLKAHLLNDLSSNYSSFGDERRSLEYAQQALAIRLNALGTRNRETVKSISSVGASYDRLGDSKRALEYEQEALAIQMELFGEFHSDTAASLGLLAATYDGLGDHKSALKYQERALAARLGVFGEQHPATATSINSIGVSYSKLGDLTQGLEYVEKALRIKLELLGERHPGVAGSFNNVGYVLGLLGNHALALEYIEKALAINLELFGERHPNTATALGNLGSAYAGLGEHSRALECQERALAIRLDLFGEHHRDTALSLSNIGTEYGLLGDYERQLEYAQRSFTIYVELLGEKHPYTAMMLNNIGVTYAQLGDHTQALIYGERALALRIELLGNQHPATIHSAKNVSRALNVLDRRAEAFNVIDGFLHNIPKSHPEYGDLQNHRKQLLAKPLRTGFRQPPSNPSKRRKGRKKKRH